MLSVDDYSRFCASHLRKLQTVQGVRSFDLLLSKFSRLGTYTLNGPGCNEGLLVFSKSTFWFTILIDPNCLPYMLLIWQSISLRLLRFAKYFCGITRIFISALLKLVWYAPSIILWITLLLGALWLIFKKYIFYWSALHFPHAVGTRSSSFNMYCSSSPIRMKQVEALADWRPLWILVNKPG